MTETDRFEIQNNNTRIVIQQESANSEYTVFFFEITPPDRCPVRLFHQIPTKSFKTMVADLHGLYDLKERLDRIERLLLENKKGGG